MSLLHEGQVLRDTYTVDRLLGEGAFAEVYRVRHRFLGRQAMKVFKMVGMTAAETERMLGEALLLSEIGHPNIIRVFDANTTDTARGICGFFTMEYIAGGSLEQFWRSHGTRFMPVDTAVEIIRKVSQGLTVAHEATPPIIHRDIKPQNILVGYDTSVLRPRLADFGLAKQVNPLTFLASARGTRSFKAPEVFRDHKSDSRASDVWALGATLYLLLADRLPVEEPTELAIGDQPIAPPSRFNPQVDPALDSILNRALAIRPERRYPTAREFLDALLEWGPRSTATGLSDTNWTTKSVLGVRSPVDEDRARMQARRALELARQAHRLDDAADLMEQAINHYPALREQYEYYLKLWRRGVAL